MSNLFIPCYFYLNTHKDEPKPTEGHIFILLLLNLILHEGK